MTKRLISHDDEKPGTGLPDIVKTALNDTYASHEFEVSSGFPPPVGHESAREPGQRMVLTALHGYVWASNGASLQRSDSVDGPWSTVVTLPGSGTLYDIKSLDGGEVMVSRSGASAGLWKSAGWDPSNPGAATWAHVLATPAAPTQPTWSTDPDSGWVTCAVYIGSGDMTGSRHGWLSTDNGDTFSIVYDIEAVHPELDHTSTHIHFLVMDPLDPHLAHPRLWLAYHTAGSDDVIRQMYSDDQGVTWTRFTTDLHHPVVGLPTPHGMVFDTDTTPTGIFIVRHKQNPADMAREPLWIIRRPGGVTMSGWATRYARGSRGEWHIAFRSSVPNVPGCIISTDGVHAGETMLYEPNASGDHVTPLGIAVHKGRMVVTSTHNPVSNVTVEVPSVEPPRGAPAGDQGQTTGGEAGHHSTASGIWSKAILRSVAVGEASVANIDGVAVGYTTTAEANGTAVGNAASAGDGGVAVGRVAKATNGIAIGISSESALNGTVVGRSAKATGDDAVAVGHFAQATGAHSLAMGASATAAGQWATSFGRAAQARAAFSTAIGRGVIVDAAHSSSIGIGVTTATTAAGQVHFGPRHIALARTNTIPTPIADQGAFAFMDNGSGKLQFVVRFPTGATQVLATEV